MFPLSDYLDQPSGWRLWLLDTDDVTEEDLEGPLTAEDEVKGWMDLLPDPGELAPDWLHAKLDDRVAYLEFQRRPLPPLESAVRVNSRVANDMDRRVRGRRISRKLRRERRRPRRASGAGFPRELAYAGQIAGTLLGVAVVAGLLTFSFVASALGVALTLV